MQYLLSSRLRGDLTYHVPPEALLDFDEKKEEIKRLVEEELAVASSAQGSNNLASASASPLTPPKLNMYQPTTI